MYIQYLLESILILYENVHLVNKCSFLAVYNKWVHGALPSQE